MCATAVVRFVLSVVQGNKEVRQKVFRRQWERDIEQWRKTEDRNQ